MPRCKAIGTHTGCIYAYENGQVSAAIHSDADVCRRYPPTLVADAHHRGSKVLSVHTPLPLSRWCGEWSETLGVWVRGDFYD